MKNNLPHLMTALVGLLLATATGCVTDAGPHSPALRLNPNLEESGGVVLLDSWSQRSITCTTVKYSRRPDGRLIISANLVNRRNFEARIEASCVFQDQHGVGVGDETPFAVEFLSANETKTLTFVAKDDRAKSATIRVRKG